MGTRKSSVAKSPVTAEDLMPPEPSLDMLERITTAATQVTVLNARLATLEQQVDETKAELRALQETVLPALMDEAGTPLIGLDDGSRLERHERVYASVSKANATDACAWLDEHGYGALVREAISVPVARGDRGTATRVVSALEGLGVAFLRDLSIHPQTLTAFVRESLSEGRELPNSIKYHVQPVVELHAPRAPRRRKRKLESTTDGDNV